MALFIRQLTNSEDDVIGREKAELGQPTRSRRSGDVLGNLGMEHSLANRHSSTSAETRDRKYFSMQLINFGGWRGGLWI